MKREYIYAYTITALIIGAMLLYSFCDSKKEKYENLTVHETRLSEFVQFSPDSTYLIFTFVPSCKFCQNSITNLNEYENLGIADRIIGLTVKDSINNLHFIETYKPEFRIITCDIFKFLEFNNRFPASFYIKNNVIRQVFRGELPEGTKFFKNSKIQNDQCEM